MLILKPNCECCDRDLAPDSSDARICTFECTFCADCVETRLAGVCPNCGGNFSVRPIRPAHLLAKYPASTERVVGKHLVSRFRSSQALVAGSDELRNR